MLSIIVRTCTSVGLYYLSFPFFCAFETSISLGGMSWAYEPVELRFIAYSSWDEVGYIRIFFEGLTASVSIQCDML